MERVFNKPRAVNRQEVMHVRIVQLCQGGCCPVVKIEEERVEIGEEGNLCVLKKEEWNTLVEKILKGELGKI